MVSNLLLVVGFDLFSGVIALMVSYYAFRARRLIESSVLSAISFGFMLLGAALLVEVVTTLSIGLMAGELGRLQTLELLENLAYLALQVVALLVIAVAYARTNYGDRRRPTGGARATVSLVALAAAAAIQRPPRLLGPVLVFFYLFLGLESVTLFVLIFIIFQGLLVYSKNKDASALLVLLGFSLIFVAHVVVLRSLLDFSGVEYLLASAVQFLGFLSLLAFVVRSGRIGSA